MRQRRSVSVLALALVAIACAGPASTPLPTSFTPPGATSTVTTAPTTAPATATALTPTPTAEGATPTAVLPSLPVSYPPATASAVASASAVAIGSPSATVPPRPDACAMTSLVLKNPPRLTLSTDNPAYPPWYGGDPATQYPGQPSGNSKWKISNPYSDMGYEDAVDYAIAATLGFTPDQIDWIPNTVFAAAFAPGEKPWDWHTAQISITTKRAENVDFSDSYFDSAQSLLALTGTPINSATSIADLKQYKLGAAANTTSYDLIQSAIMPTQAASVYPDDDTALTALENGQIDGLVVDLGTAFYMRDAELSGTSTGGTIVGQFSSAVQTDQVGATLDKDSPLTPCVDWAIQTMKANGTLQQIYDQWITTGQDIPLLQ